MIEHKYIKEMCEAHKKGDFEELEKGVQQCLAHLEMHKHKPDFKKIAADTTQELRLWLERFYFTDPRFIKNSVSSAQRYVDHII